MSVAESRTRAWLARVQKYRKALTTINARHVAGPREPPCFRLQIEPGDGGIDC